MKRMRVLTISGDTFYGFSGVRTVALQVIRHLGLRPTPHVIGVVSDIPPPVPHDNHFPISCPIQPADHQHLKAAILAFEPEVVHVLSAGIKLMRMTQLVLGELAASGKKVPWSITIHNVPPFEQSSPFFLGRNNLFYIARKIVKLPTAILWSRFLSSGTFSAVVCHSPVIKDQLVRAGCAKGKIFQADLAALETNISASDTSAPGVSESDVSTTGISDQTASLDIPGWATASPRLLSAGGLAHNKGFHDAVTAVMTLRETHPKLLYVIAGASRGVGYENFLKAHVKKLELSDNIHIKPDLHDQQLERARRECDLYIQPSHEEGFCLAFLEAAMSAQRVLGTDTGAMKAISAGQPGMDVVRPKDPGALAHAAAALLSQNVTPQQIASRRVSLLSRYNWERYAMAYEEMFRRVLNEPRTE